MSNNVVEFMFDQNKIRTTLVEDSVWFVASDVSKSLGYSQTNAMNKLVEDEDKQKRTLYSGGNYVNQSLISESGLYQAIFNSTLPDAKRFKRWVTSTVLPSLRKTGGYVVGEEHVQSEDEMIYLAMQMMERKIQAMKPKADYHDQWMSSEGTYTTSQVAKQLGISARKLNQFLKQEGVKWQNKDLPKAGYEDWFKVIEVAYDNKQSGETGINTQCRVNTEGVQEILSLYQKKAS